MSTAIPGQPPEGSVLRFAVAMRGGVSLAVWIGGALSEIDAVREPPTEALARALLRITRFSRLEVDILTGASAGGLNAALGGLAIATGARMNLRPVWLKVADIDKLLTPPADGRRLRSLLNGDYFLREVEGQLTDLQEEGKPGQARPVELFLATTIVGGVQVTDSTDPTVREPRRGAYFHFRHLASARPFSDLDAHDEVASRVGLAARSTASFPGAFEPVMVVVRQFAGRLLLPAVDPAPTTLRVFDGGILDNIPVARAIQAVATSPAQDSVRRWVVFLHPSPSALGPAPSRSVPDAEPSLLQMVQDVVSGRGTETLLDDLEALRTHNRESESQRLQRFSLCEAALHALRVKPPGPFPHWITRAICGPERNAPVPSIASVDADRLYAVLEDPTSGSGWVPVGKEPPVSPLVGKSQDERFKLRMAILQSTVDETRNASVRPFARVVRMALFVVEWIRWEEARSDIELGGLRRRVYDLMLVGLLLDAALERTFVTGGDERFPLLKARLDEVRTSAALHQLVSDLKPDSEESEALHLRDRLPPRSRMTLDTLAGGTFPVPPNSGADRPTKGVDERLLDGLAGVGVALASQPAVPAKHRSVFETLTECLGRSPDVTKVGTHLLAVDTACAGLHRGRTVGVPTTLEYYKISGAAGSPLASGGGELGSALPTFRSLRSSGTGIDPNAKLSGNSLGNFSAFVAPRFRANDWMWGRMDAAAGLVDILLRPAYLQPDAIKAVEVAVKEPFYTVEDEKLRASGEVVCKELWSTNAGIVEDEIKGLTADSDLAQTRRLLTARWQLEIFLYEAAAMCIQPLQPGGKGEVLPPLRAVDAGAPDALPAARANVATVMASYEDSPRRVSDVWGQRKTTALGVKVARAAAGAVVPDGGILNAVKRTALAAPLMILVAAALARGGFLVAISVLVNVLLVPRLNASAAVVTLAVLGFGALWLFRTIAGPSPGWRRWITAFFTLAAFGYGVVTVVVDRWGFSDPSPFPGRWPWDVPGDRVRGVVISMVVVGALVAFATYLLWNWAKPRWAFAVPVVAGGVMATWVPVGAWQHQGKPLSLAGHVLSLFGSMWFPAAVLLLLTAVVTMRLKPENR